MAEQLSTTEYAVLGLLTFGERSGYELDALARRTIGYFWHPAKSKIYAVLPRLVERGLASAAPVTQDKRPDKVTYSITVGGERALRSWLRSGKTVVAPARNELLLKLFFGRLVEPEVLHEQVAAHRGRAAAQLAELEEIEAAMNLERADEDFFPFLTLLHGLEDARSTIAWADEVLRLLDERLARRPDVR
jgi:DNA-binding PadR family transcriptional regulator